jgi:hypothetical protein
MKFIPKRKQIVGRTVDVQETKDGIALPDEKVQHVTCFVHVDAIGPEVTQCTVGDLILHKRLSHVFLRDNTHVVVVDDEDVLCAIETTPEERARMKIEGAKDYEGGRRALEAAQ